MEKADLRYPTKLHQFSKELDVKKKATDIVAFTLKKSITNNFVNVRRNTERRDHRVRVSFKSKES